jgi:phosphate starvation-inducible PhoH-like protein
MKKKKHLEDKSPIVPQKHKIKNEIEIHQRELTSKQKQFLDVALDKNTKVMFVSGPAGTSKTYMAILTSLIGFLPGEADEKMAPYIQPLLEKLSELTTKASIDTLQKEQRIDSIPIGFLRGLNWNARCIVADESQNMTYKELVTLVTRVGEFSKVFILGDPDQSDINGKSGFVKMMNHFEDTESRENGIHTFKFDEDDIVRSALVRFIIKKLKQTNV